MDCINHRNKDATNTCYKCGSWLCDDCVVDAGGRILCRSCAEGRSARPAAPAHRTNGFFYFLLSCTVPGANFMYLGMMKRGLFLMSSFFLTISLIAMFGIWQLSFVIGIMWVASFFDGYAKRRRVNAGEYIPDSVEDIMSVVRRYKYHIIFVLGGLAALNVLSDLYRNLRYQVWLLDRVPAIIPVVCLIIVIYGIYMVGKSRGKRRDSDGSDQ